jgi:hypothetical protein
VHAELRQLQQLHRFMATNISDCSGTAFNYEPEYNNSAPQNIVRGRRCR